MQTLFNFIKIVFGLLGSFVAAYWHLITSEKDPYFNAIYAENSFYLPTLKPLKIIQNYRTGDYFLTNGYGGKTLKVDFIFVAKPYCIGIMSLSNKNQDTLYVMENVLLEREYVFHDKELFYSALRGIPAHSIILFNRIDEYKWILKNYGTLPWFPIHHKQ